MYSSVQLTAKYLHYYLTAYNGKGHGMHSPFVFQFILNVLNNGQRIILPHSIEEQRAQYLKDGRRIVIDDMGAGSRISSTKERTVKELAAAAVKPKKYSQLLYRLVHYYQPSNIIELGTSLGITTAYLSMAHPAAKVYTIEGSKEIYAIAKAGFEQRNLKNIIPLQGNFDDVLPPLLQSLQSVDVGYIDGNHRYAPTINYFHLLLKKVHHHSILIFDDIHWSKEMEAAWEEIKNHPEVRCTIDTFFLGFVFFRREFKEKQHFSIRY